MNIRKVVFVLCIAGLFLGLNACKSKGSSHQMQNVGDNKYRLSLKWKGTYTGILPCADCSGIETKLTLNPDDTYQISWKYLGKSDNLYQHEGTFVWDCMGGIISLNNLDNKEYPTMYLVYEDYLQQLDSNGNKITGELACKYILKK